MLLARSCSCEAHRVFPAGAYINTDTCHSPYDLDVGAAKTACLIVLLLFGFYMHFGTQLAAAMGMTLKCLIHTERTIEL